MYCTKGVYGPCLRQMSSGVKGNEPEMCELNTNLIADVGTRILKYLFWRHAMSKQ